MVGRADVDGEGLGLQSGSLCNPVSLDGDCGSGVATCRRAVKDHNVPNPWFAVRPSERYRRGLVYNVIFQLQSTGCMLCLVLLSKQTLQKNEKQIPKFVPETKRATVTPL